MLRAGRERSGRGSSQRLTASRRLLSMMDWARENLLDVSDVYVSSIVVVDELAESVHCFWE